MVGNFQFSQICKDTWINWYESYDETSTLRTCSDPAFNGWYSRKPMFLQKLAQCLSASESNTLTLEWKYFERAIQLVEEVEHAMGRTFTAVGKSDVATEVDSVMAIIRRYKVISEKQVMQMVWRDIDSSKFENVIMTATKTGLFEKKFKGPDGQSGTWYYYKGDDE